jgi:hypothetical protein
MTLGSLLRALVIGVVAPALGLSVAAPAAVAAPLPDTEYTQSVSIFYDNPCAGSEFTTSGGWIRLDLTKRVQGDRLTLRATLSPHLWYWYGYNKTDPGYDPTLPTLGDPDWVYDITGSSKDRAVLVGRPSAADVTGEFTVSARAGGEAGPSDGLVVHYVVTYSIDADGMSLATVTDLDITCPNGTFIEDVPFVSS